MIWTIAEGFSVAVVIVIVIGFFLGGSKNPAPETPQAEAQRKLVEDREQRQALEEEAESRLRTERRTKVQDLIAGRTSKH